MQLYSFESTQRYSRMNNGTRLHLQVSDNWENRLHPNFWLSSVIEHINSTKVEVARAWDKDTEFEIEGLLGQIVIKTSQQHSVITTGYYRTHLSDFLSNFGGLALSIISFTRFLLLPYQ